MITEEQRIKLSEAMKKRWGNPIDRKKFKDNLWKIQHTPEATIRNKEKCKNMNENRNYKGYHHPQWKGGKRIQLGYIYLFRPNHPFCNYKKLIQEHRWNMEIKLSRILMPYEVVHHIDGNSMNNNINNLMLFSNNQEHLKYHRRCNNV